MDDAIHIPVLAEEVLRGLAPQPGETVLDGTLGLGGHARMLAEAVGEGGMLIGLDRDPQALALARERLASLAVRHVCHHAAFSQMREVLDRMGVMGVDRILLDIGVSSLQLDNGVRGFSFQNDGPLDMRMDSTQPLTAKEIVMTWPEEELGRVFRDFGEERYWRRIAKEIADARRNQPIETTGQLAGLIERLVGRRGRLHPATRTFQGLRIAVNDELGELQRGLEAALASLRPGGRLAVITFHSLEDRIAKQVTRGWAEAERVQLVNRKVIKPSEEECQRNRRARSAKLRICEKRDTACD